MLFQQLWAAGQHSPPVIRIERFLFVVRSSVPLHLHEMCVAFSACAQAFAKRSKIDSFASIPLLMVLVAAPHGIRP